MQKKRLSYYVFFSIVLIGTITLSITSFLWIGNIYQTYQREAQRIQESYTNKVKDELKNRVDTIVSLINYRKATTEARLQRNIQSRVHELNGLMTYLYESNRDKLSDADIKKLITEAVRGMRFNDGRGYYFIDTLQGDVILYPVAPSTEGSNLFYLQDERGNYSLQQEIQLVNKHGKGFIEGYWTLPGEDTQKDHKKITYVHKFAPYDWYFGTGEYLDITTREVQEEIKSYINQLSYGDDGKQYVFIHDFEGNELANGRFPELIGQNHYEMTMSPKVQYIDRQIEIASTAPHHGFLTHLWPNFSNGNTSNKLTYIAAIPSWGWAIGSGANMEDLNNAISRHQNELYNQLISGIQKALMLAAGIFILSVIAARYVSKKMNASIKLFTRNLETSSAQLSLIDEGKVIYQEFEELAKASNNTTQRINTLLHKDELTGLFNRRYINVLFESLLQQAKKDDSNFSLIMLDIDHFKRINDTYGHPFGDQVLMKIAQCIATEVSTKGYVGRFGGEEMMVLLPNYNAEQAFEIAMQIKTCVEQIRLPGQNFSVSISGGISSGTNATTFELIQQADSKLYCAKNNGRNRIER